MSISAQFFPTRPKVVKLSTGEDATRCDLSDESFPLKRKNNRSRGVTPRIRIEEFEVDDDVFYPFKENDALPGSSLLSPFNGNTYSKKKILPSFDSSPKHLLSINSPMRANILSFGLDIVEKNISVLGKGSFGTVILGKLNDKRVAVKVIRRIDQMSGTCAGGEGNAELLYHENIVKVYGVFSNQIEKDDHSIIVMEYAGKTNLQRLIDENNPVLTHGFTHKCLRDISDALSYCHSRGVWHLDVKPSNVFVSSRGMCKLGDFGCSRLAGVVNPEPKLLGTPGYQAPEMLRGFLPTDKSDVFSFGILTWQVIHREKPYDGLHPHAIVFKVVSEAHRPGSSQRLSSHFEGYQRIYKSCWNDNPLRRPEMKEVHSNIQSLILKRKVSSSIKIRL